MKEYRFDPPSKMIKVVEGATMKINLFGKRVAFSAYGSVTSLNGEPETGLLVEVQGQGDCDNLQEEATTEENGSFRIRGLQPTVSSNSLSVNFSFSFSNLDSFFYVHAVYLRVPSEIERRG